MAQALGIEADQVFAGVKPAGKAEMVGQLRERGRCVAMIGDGINDAAALATADVGIAMGGGVGAASQVASIVLLGDRLPQVSGATSCLNSISAPCLGISVSYLGISHGGDEIELACFSCLYGYVAAE